MWNGCWKCGLYRADKWIDPDGPAAVCPECGFRHPFRQLPLLLVSGASCSGKSTVCQALIGKLDEVILFNSDILWRSEFNTPDNNYRAFFETWLRVCKNIGPGGRPVVLFGAGVGVPENLERCVERCILAEAMNRTAKLALTVQQNSIGCKPAFADVIWYGINCELRHRAKAMKHSLRPRAAYPIGTPSCARRAGISK